ncbi:MAG: XTP/dITP diphosphatase [Deltaproteobacteria bacterium]|nr:XTP/dITP diphosphatase [Deltaproteobacteria bacterium]
MKLLFATANANKVRELKQLLAKSAIELLSSDDVGGLAPVEEDGTSFAENALKKARAAAEQTGYPAIADDSGLQVDALGGRPGVHSARYAGPNATDQQRNEKLLGELAELGEVERGARFVCAIALVYPDGRHVVVEDECRGQILEAPAGTGGFGYDPLFFVPELGCTFAEAEASLKNQLSHRGRALRQLVKLLES